MPLNWKPSKVFYGWWVVAASLFVALYVSGGVFYGFTAIFEPIANELGWSYTQVSFASSLRGMEMGILAPILGVFVDRWGPRRIIFIGAIIITSGLILLSRTTSLVMFYGAFALIATGTSTCSMAVLMTAVANWFRDKVGIASGIAISGFGLGGILLPVVSRLVDIYDWRRTMIIIAVGTLVTILPLSFVFRHKPEQYGYLPDGRVKSQITPDTSQSPAPATEAKVKMSQIIKSSVFWRIALAFTTHMILVGSTITHVMPYLSSIGVDRSTSSFIAMAIPLMSIGGRLTFGWLGDRFDRKRVAIGAFIMMSMGMLCFSLISNAGLWLLVPFLILFGIGYGGSNVTRASLTREYFGRSSFGTIFGFIVGINMMGSIAGSPLAGWVFDTWGSYQGIWLIYASLPIIALISILSIRPVRGELSNKT